MRSACILSVLVALSGLPSYADDDPLTSLGWLSGTWAGTSGTVRQLEHWTAPEGGVILGLHRDVFEDDRSFFEYLRIERRGDDVFYVAMPRGDNATDFRLTEQGDQRVVFENPEHDFPQKIVYERDGDTLIATIEGPANGEIRRTGWRWQRVTPE